MSDKGNPNMPRKKITRLDVAIEFFLKGYKNSQTKRTYSLCFKLFTASIGEGRTVQSIAPIDIQRFINTQIERGNNENTIEKRHRELRAFFNWCIKMKYIESSPTTSFKMKKPRVAIDERKVISVEEILKLIHFLEVNRDTMILLMVRLLAETGCRRGGLAGMRISDLDLENCTAVVFEKDKKERPVYFSEETAKVAQRWLEHRPICDHDYLFVGKIQPHEPMQAPSIAQVIRRRCLSAGVGSWGTHTFRHRKGFEMFKTGAAPILVAEVLGHADGGIIAQKHYSDYRREAVRSLAESTFPTEKSGDAKSANSDKIIDIRSFKR